MKSKIIVLLIVILAAVLCIATVFLVSKKETLTIPAPEPIVDFDETFREYTKEEVAAHKDASSCWTIIRTEVYELTNWIKQHPGGAQAILGLCGKDGTVAFESQHGGSQKQEDVLSTFKIGTYKK
jgi:cytochrome b involved in lipid metabolism